MSRKVGLIVLSYSHHAIWTPKSAKIQLPKIHPQHPERELSSSITVNNCQRPSSHYFLFLNERSYRVSYLTDVFSQCGKTLRKLLNVSEKIDKNRTLQSNELYPRSHDNRVIIIRCQLGSVGFLHDVGARASVMFFLKTFIFLLFKVTESHQKAMSKVRTIVCKYPAQ